MTGVRGMDIYGAQKCFGKNDNADLVVGRVRIKNFVPPALS